MGKKGAWSLYEYNYETRAIKLKNRKCPRCGKIMARHSDPPRWTCGACSYTEYIREKKQS